MVSAAKLTQFSIVCKLGQLIVIMMKEFPCFRKLERKVVRAKAQDPPESKKGREIAGVSLAQQGCL